MQEIVVREIRHRMANFTAAPINRACLWWTKHTVDVLNEFGFRAIPQAGSLNWRMVAPELDDGIMATHFSYEFHVEEAAAHVLSGRLPEIHCWAALPDYPSKENPSIVDLTTRYLIQNAAESGFEWRNRLPPDYLWATADEIDDAHYTASVPAILVALSAIKKLQREGHFSTCQSIRVM